MSKTLALSMLMLPVAFYAYAVASPTPGCVDTNTATRLDTLQVDTHLVGTVDDPKKPPLIAGVRQALKNVGDKPIELELFNDVILRIGAPFPTPEKRGRFIFNCATFRSVVGAQEYFSCAPIRRAYRSVPARASVAVPWSSSASANGQSLYDPASVLQANIRCVGSVKGSHAPGRHSPSSPRQDKRTSV